jgi:hypothetical protein
MVSPQTRYYLHISPPDFFSCLIYQVVFRCHCEHLKGARQSHTHHEIASAVFDSLAMTKKVAQFIGQLCLAMTLGFENPLMHTLDYHPIFTLEDSLYNYKV